MKWSNTLLSFVAACMVGLTIVTTSAIVKTTPTAVISASDDLSASPIHRGGGFAMNLPRDLSPRQVQVLSMAYEVAKTSGLPQPQLLQGIVLQESDAGAMKSYAVAGQEFGLKTNERYYGLAQIKLVAAKAVLKRWPQLRQEFGFTTNTDEEIIAKLITDDKFNLTVAAKYLIILRDQGFHTIQQLALAYNQGPGGAQLHDPSTFAYSRSVMKHIRSIEVASR